MNIGKIYIFHMTHISNLPLILEKRGLLCKNMVVNKRIEYVNISNTSVQNKRYAKNVPIEPYGILHDYVPFYFCTLNPMLYAIYSGKVDTYTEGQENVIFLVSTIPQVTQAKLNFVFTDGHAIMALTQFFKDIADLDKLNWEVIKAKYWPEFTDGSRLRQAEFLVHKFFPWEHILGIGVLNNQSRNKVIEILRKGEKGKIRPVVIKPDWYF
ncbi:DUF4433 domain-containing protein [Thermoflavimicrobium daqui]|jgi:hypothetical protein|uniref:DUF4433 domain-containing protein n=1 Tax=Thermoflavimicrobium daqui TaxID=2137476 RepID=A0A364K688_9BACL|nr:DUF4433 domain-containing protein [Thermoflavimicrobium daqui]RAL25700.1 DUF4433 domain-containing protein [Thermoflavimicrobium daqui]